MVTVAFVASGDGSGVIALNGRDCSGRCSSIVARSGTVVLSAAPDTKSEVGAWSDLRCAGTRCELVADRDLSISVEFTAKPQMARPKLCPGATNIERATAGSLPAVARYAATDIGKIVHPEEPNSEVIAMNAKSVVLGMSYGGTPGFKYWLYDSATGTWTDVRSTLDFRPVAINGGGDLLGIAAVAGPWRASILRNAAEDLLLIDPVHADYQLPSAINDSGMAVGSFLRVRGNRDLHSAFAWSAKGLIELGTLGGGDAEATAVNNAGLVVGWSTVDDGLLSPSHAFVWQDGELCDLGTMGLSTWSSTGTAVDDQGRVAGRLDGPTRERKIFLYDGTKILDLGTPPNCQWVCHPTGMNSLGQIVGQARDDREFAPGYHGWVWENGAFAELDSLVSLPGLTIEIPRGIDDAGQIATSARTATAPYTLRALLLVPTQ